MCVCVCVCMGVFVCVCLQNKKAVETLSNRRYVGVCVQIRGRESVVLFEGFNVYFAFIFCCVDLKYV